MKRIPVQLVMVELDNGRRGVFFGPPLTAEGSEAGDFQLEQVWLSEVSYVPEDTDLAELSRQALEQFESEQMPRH